MVYTFFVEHIYSFTIRSKTYSLLTVDKNLIYKIRRQARFRRDIFCRDFIPIDRYLLGSTKCRQPYGTFVTGDVKYITIAQFFIQIGDFARSWIDPERAFSVQASPDKSLLIDVKTYYRKLPIVCICQNILRLRL